MTDEDGGALETEINEALDKDSEYESDSEPENLRDRQFTDMMLAQEAQIYRRSRAVLGLERAFVDLYTAAWARVTPSGILAVSAALRGSIARFDGPVVLVHDTQVRLEVHNLLRCIARDVGPGNPGAVELLAMDCTNRSTMLYAFNNSRVLKGTRRVIIFAEACYNPGGQVFAFGALKELRARNTMLVVIIDDTWTTIAGCNAFELGATVVTSSLAEYYSGNAVAAAGVVLGASDLDMNIPRWCDLNGVRVPAQTATAVFANLPSFAARYHKAGDIALRVVTALAASTQYGTVAHPAVSAHPGYADASATLLAWPPAFSVTRTPIRQKDFYRAVHCTTTLVVGPSLGGAQNCINPWIGTVPNVSASFCVAIGYGGASDVRFEPIVQDLLLLMST